MDDPNEENIGDWVYVDDIDIAEEATSLDQNDSNDILIDDVNKIPENLESDIDSDGISVISESNLLESNTDEDTFENNEHIENHVNEPHHQEATDDNTEIQSASTPKPNWIFIDSKATILKNDSSNQFYLNCLQEPIQELTEQDFRFVQPDLESDGISVISESESFSDLLSEDQKVLSKEVLDINVVENGTDLVSKMQFSMKKYCNGVIIGTILIATTSLFLGHVFSTVEQIEEEVPIFQEEFKNDLAEESSGQVPDFKDKYNVQTALAYCGERHKADDMFMEHNIKKCLKKIENRIRRKRELANKKEEIRKLEKYLKIKQQFLDEKEKFLIKREYELIKAEMKLKQDHLKNETINSILKDDKVYNDETRNMPKDSIDSNENLNNNPVNLKLKRNKKWFKFSSKSYELNNDKPLSKGKKQKSNKKVSVQMEKLNDCFSESSENKRRKKKQYEKREFKEDKKVNSKYKKTKSVDYDTTNILKNRTRVFEMKQFKSVIKPKENKFAYKNFNGKEEKEPTGKHKYHREDNKLENNDNTDYVILGNSSTNLTISGYWVEKLYKSRSDIRNKEHSGDWYFDRVSYRKGKRDKAKWYFDWMNSRELFRYKRIYYT